MAVNRAKKFTKRRLRKDWIDKRISKLKYLTDEWKERDIKGIDYAILTNEIYKGTFEQDHKSLMKIKGLDKERR